MRLVTQTEAGMEVGVTLQRINYLVRTGRLIKYKDSKVDLDEVVTYFKESTSREPSREDVKLHTEEKKRLNTMAKAKTSREVYIAKKAKLEVEALEGTLIPKADVVKDASELASKLRSRLLSFPAKLSPKLEYRDAKKIKQISVP